MCFRCNSPAKSLNEGRLLFYARLENEATWAKAAGISSIMSLAMIENRLLQLNRQLGHEDKPQSEQRL